MLFGDKLREYVLEVQRRRSFTKAVTFRVLIVALDVPVVYLLTGRLDLAVVFTVVSNLYASIAYYMHERIWNKISWGKTK